jgi:hypothetical protein
MPLDDLEALIWLRSQPEGRVAVNAAKLGRQWGWNRMRTSRRLKAWEQAGLIRRNAGAITVTGSVTPTVTEDTRSLLRLPTSQGCPELRERAVPRHRSGSLLLSWPWHWLVYRLLFPLTA